MNTLSVHDTIQLHMLRVCVCVQTCMFVCVFVYIHLCVDCLQILFTCSGVPVGEKTAISATHDGLHDLRQTGGTQLRLDRHEDSSYFSKQTMLTDTITDWMRRHGHGTTTATTFMSLIIVSRGSCSQTLLSLEIGCRWLGGYIHWTEHPSSEQR